MNKNNNNKNNKSNISSFTDPILTRLVMEGFWDKTTSSSLSLLLTKLEIITITTETTIITTKTKTIKHSRTKYYY